MKEIPKNFPTHTASWVWKREYRPDSHDEVGSEVGPTKSVGWKFVWTVIEKMGKFDRVVVERVEKFDWMMIWNLEEIQNYVVVRPLLQ
jgi:hypothetical protein